ncbi:arylesterase [SAR86 cluster bacterium]|jgi:acyl-CoA thioesterase-1|nr:arylesterase [SAR86 cluster bacterium]
MKALSLFIFILIASTTSSEENNSILIYGDSISAGYGMEKESQWSESLKTLLSDKGFEISVYNRSVSGETTGGGLTRISRILDELKPTFLLLELGGNDALRGYPPKKIYENLNKMIEASKERGIDVFLMQIRILPNYGKRYQTQFESIYPTLSKEKEVILLPFMLNDIALKKELMLSDGIHPNKDAQPLIAEIVFNSLKPHLK